MTGLLLLDKPPGMTSFSAVARARRILGAKKAGHTGTLDPMATGVLPVLLGGATRFAEYLPSHDKAYLAGFRLGIRTDTLDITGEITDERPVHAARGDVERALARFRGKIMQVPPMVSAIQKDGVRLYELARRGIEIEREAREVEVYALELVDDNTIYVECSAGTYIRSLIDDLGQCLGCGAAMSSLRRVKANGYGIERCVTLEQLEQSRKTGFVALDEAFLSYPAVYVIPAQALRFRNGGALDLARVKTPLVVEGAFYRVYDGERFLGLGRVQGEELAVARLLAESFRL
jgi:tRNA pseudouridine55 synthase